MNKFENHPVSIWEKTEDQINLELHQGRSVAFCLVVIGVLIVGGMALAELIGKYL